MKLLTGYPLSSKFLNDLETAFYVFKVGDVERASGPFEANKFEFINSDDTIVDEGTLYFISYTKDKNELFLDMKLNPIIPKNPTTLFAQYKNTKGSLSREFYYKSHKLIVLKKHRKKGTIKRFFARRNDDISQRIFEIKEQQFGMDSIFYDKISLDWKLNGSEDDIKLQNIKALKETDKTLSGIADLLNPLEFYIKEDLTVKEKVKNTLKLLEHHDYQYETREEAKTAALGLGLKKVHLMKNGYWMVGRNHEEYMEAIGHIPTKKAKITTMDVGWLKRARKTYQRAHQKKRWSKPFKRSYS